MASANFLRPKVYGYAVYQHRITLIRRRDPGHFGVSTYLLFSLLAISLITIFGVPRPSSGACAHQWFLVLRRAREFHHQG